MTSKIETDSFPRVYIVQNDKEIESKKCFFVFSFLIQEIKRDVREDGAGSTTSSP